MGSPDGSSDGNSRPKLWIVGEEDDQDPSLLNDDADLDDLFE